MCAWRRLDHIVDFILISDVIVFGAEMSSRASSSSAQLSLQESIDTIQKYCRGEPISKSSGSSTKIDPLGVPSDSTAPLKVQQPVPRGADMSSSTPQPVPSALRSPLRRKNSVPDNCASPGSPQNSLEDRTAFLDVVWFLRCRYGDMSRESACSRDDLSSFSEGDINGLLKCLGTELANTAHKDRQKNLLSPGDPKRVNFAPSFTVPRIPFDDISSSDATGHPRVPEEKVAAPTMPLPKTLKEALLQLRRGEVLVKFDRHGAPAMRYACVMDRRTLFHTEMVTMPHFCWSADPGQVEPSGMVPLIYLKEVHSGPSVNVQKDENGVVLDVRGCPIRDEQCLALVFTTRTIEVALRRPDVADSWMAALQLIIARNTSMGTILSKEEKSKQKQLLS